MIRRTPATTIGRAGIAAACLAVTGLALAACGPSHSNSSGNSSGGSGTGGSGSGTSTPAASSSSSGSGGSTSVVSSSSVPFPIAVGNTWVYQATSLGGLKSTVTNKVVSVTPVSGGNEVTMSDTESLTGTPTDITYIFHSNGSITYPFSQLGSSATIVSGTLEWPPASVIDSGGTSTSTVEIAMTAGGSKQDVVSHITVKGDGTASVTVPAGTYSATIVQMTETFTIEGYNETLVVKTWMANGVGPVQSEASLDAAGRTEIVSRQELESFTAG
jgi:hypothetical protein